MISIKKVTNIFLLFPLFGHAQELPNEDWVCLTDIMVSTSMSGKETSVNEEDTNFNGRNWVFNPSKGVKILGAADFEEGYSCMSKEDELWGNQYRCSNLTNDGSASLFQMNVSSGQYTFTNSRSLQALNEYDRPFTSAATAVGICSKL